MRDVLEEERARERLVRTVPCPLCRRQPGQPCRYTEDRVPWSSHTARYLLAVGAGLVPPLPGQQQPPRPGSPVPPPNPKPGPRPTPTHPPSRPTKAAA
jgi:hypothetical protein